MNGCILLLILLEIEEYKPRMTRALPINPIRPMIPKNTGTTIDTTRSSGHSVVSFICRRSAASSHIRIAVAFADSLHMLKYIFCCRVVQVLFSLSTLITNALTHRAEFCSPVDTRVALNQIPTNKIKSNHAHTCEKILLDLWGRLDQPYIFDAYCNRFRTPVKQVHALRIG